MNWLAAPVPPFSLTKDRYDQSTLLGRVQRSYSLTDVRTLFTSRETLERAKQLLEQYRLGTIPSGVSDAQLWKARKTVESMVHPVTGEVINPFLRFGMYAPMNVFIVTMMLLPSTINSVPRTIFIHWYNQSYNCGVNYANRSGDTEGSEQSAGRLLEGYAAAVSTSLSIALSATWISRKTQHLKSPVLSTFIRATLPFTAVVFAGWANIALMRRHEWVNGVPVFDKDGTIVGDSKIAGQSGLLKCGSARLLWNIPGMVVPGAVLGWLSNKQFWLRRNPAIRFFTEVSLIAACLWVGVPPALALFPQTEEVAVTKLEDRFHNLTRTDGTPITHLYYNKGL